MSRHFVERRQNVRISGGIHVGRARPREVGQRVLRVEVPKISLEEVFGRELLMGFHGAELAIPLPREKVDHPSA